MRLPPALGPGGPGGPDTANASGRLRAGCFRAGRFRGGRPVGGGGRLGLPRLIGPLGLLLMFLFVEDGLGSSGRIR
ncbi:hypothetical protein [Streptomyces sp. NPDC059168]|uniref:hypothetical protein n=1 Tax=Streptomyces sp. NPDC059168 TaxID=3346753 RepID=UPI0036835DFD